MGRRSDKHIPYPVLGLVVENDWNLLTAWCRYLCVSWEVVAERAGMGLMTLSKYERTPNGQSEDLEKIATALGLNPDQLVDR